jgi:hypothetical protein
VGQITTKELKDERKNFSKKFSTIWVHADLIGFSIYIYIYIYIYINLCIKQVEEERTVIMAKERQLVGLRVGPV